MKTKEITCISCPAGCHVVVSLKDSKKILKIDGAKCSKGVIYAQNEITNPVRTVTTTVRILNSSDLKLLPVKTSSPVPKDKTFDVIKDADNISIEAPVAVGDIIIENVAKTDANLLATSSAKI